VKIKVLLKDYKILLKYMIIMSRCLLHWIAEKNFYNEVMKVETSYVH